MIVLRDFQKECVSQMDKLTSGLLLAPTGSGKTIMGMALAWKEISRGGRVTFVVPRENLVKQTYQSAIAWNLSVGLILGEESENRIAPLQIATYQSLGSKKRSLDWLDSTTTWIIDEAHITAFADSLKLPVGVRKLGLTATPWQMGRKRSLLEVFEKVVFAPSPRKLIEMGFLSPPVYFCPTGKGNGKRFDPSPGFIWHWWEKLAKEEKTFIFTNSITQANEIALHFQDQGISAIAVTGCTPKKQVEFILDEFSKDNGKYLVLTTCNKLAEGCDNPKATCIVLANRTESKSGAFQRIGRGARISPGKSHFKIIDCVGVAKQFGTLDEIEPSLEDFALAEPKQGTMAQKECRNCNAYNLVTAKTCKFCGHSFDVVREFDPLSGLKRMTKSKQEDRAIAAFHSLLLKDFLSSTQVCDREFLQQFGYYPISNWIADAQLPVAAESAAVKAAWRQFKKITSDRLSKSIQLPLPISFPAQKT